VILKIFLIEILVEALLLTDIAASNSFLRIRNNIKYDIYICFKLEMSQTDNISLLNAGCMYMMGRNYVDDSTS
jgi:hypothetical protein